MGTEVFAYGEGAAHRPTSRSISTGWLAPAARGLPFIVLDPAGLEGIWADIQRVADRLGVPERGRATVARLQDRVNAVKAAPRNASLRLYWEWWPKPIYTPGRTNWLTELSEAVGCTNIFADYDVPNVRVDDPQEVVRRAPDVMEEGLFNRPSPRLVDGLEHLAGILRNNSRG